MSRRTPTHYLRQGELLKLLGATSAGSPNPHAQTLYKQHCIRVVRAGQHLAGDHLAAEITLRGEHCLTIHGRPGDGPEVLKGAALDAVTAHHNGRAWNTQAKRFREETGLEVLLMPSSQWKPWNDPEVGREDYWLDPEVGREDYWLDPDTPDDDEGNETARDNWDRQLARQEKALKRKGTRIVILYNDSLTVHYIWVVQRAAKPRTKADKDTAKAGLSYSLVSDIQSERTRALRTAVSEMPTGEASRLFVALILLAEISGSNWAPLNITLHQITHDEAEREAWQAAVRKLEALLPAEAEGDDDTTPREHREAKRETLLDTLLNIPEVLTEQLLVAAMLRSLSFESKSGLEPSGVGAYLAQLAGLEARHYQVTDADLKRFPRARLEELAAGTDMVDGAVPAYEPAKMRKGDLAVALAERRVVPEEYLASSLDRSRLIRELEP